MKICLLDIKSGTKLNSKFNSVNMRNFEILSGELNADFIYSEYDTRLNNKYDICIVGFGSKNTEVKKSVPFLINNCKHIIIMVGEYEHNDNPALFYSKREFHVIRNYVGKSLVGSKKLQLSDTIINLNTIIIREPNNIGEKLHDCIYYGRYRSGRRIYFSKYLHFPIWLSTSPKNFRKFKDDRLTSRNITALNWGNSDLDLFRYSLYIEDVHTHNNYNYLANRYYEAGIHNNVIFFDINCTNTILLSEISEYYNDIKYYIVQDYDSLICKIKECNNNFEKHLSVQKKWRINELKYRDSEIKKIKNLCNNIFNNTQPINNN